MSNLIKYSPVGKNYPIDPEKKYNPGQLIQKKINGSTYASVEEILPSSDRPYTFYKNEPRQLIRKKVNRSTYASVEEILPPSDRPYTFYKK